MWLATELPPDTGDRLTGLLKRATALVFVDGRPERGGHRPAVVRRRAEAWR